MSDGVDIDEVIGRAETGAMQALYVLVQEVLAGARENIPPTDPEDDPEPGVTLRESGRIVQDGMGWIVVFETPYAAKQHEALTFEHPRGGGPKFLEREIKAAVPRVPGAVASGVASNLHHGDRVRAYERSGQRIASGDRKDF